MTDERARYDEFWNTFHELWGMWHDGAPYSQAVKDKWGRLLHLGKEGGNMREAAPAQGSADLSEICAKCKQRRGEHYDDACPTGEVLRGPHPIDKFAPAAPPEGEGEKP